MLASSEAVSSKFGNEMKFKPELASENKMNVNSIKGLSSSDDSQFYFWAKQLVNFLDDKSVIFSCFENNKLKRIQLISVVKALKDIDYFDAVENINYLPHPSFIKLSFNATSMVEIFMDTVDKIEDKAIKFVVKSELMQTCVISVANLPPDLIEQFVNPVLCKWGIVVRMRPQLIPRKNGGNVQIGQTKIDFRFNDGFSVCDLPYFIRVFGFKVFLNIRGRNRICFRCNSPDHLVSDCILRYCGLCRSLKRVDHTCVITYAAVMKSAVTLESAPIFQDELLVEMDTAAQDDDRAVKELLSVQVNDRSIFGVPDSPEEEMSDSASGGIAVQQVPQVKTVGFVKRMRTRSLTRLSDRDFACVGKKNLDNSFEFEKMNREPKRKKRGKVEKAVKDSKDIMEKSGNVLSKVLLNEKFTEGELASDSNSGDGSVGCVVENAHVKDEVFAGDSVGHLCVPVQDGKD